jgi:hypothetical protein
MHYATIVYNESKHNILELVGKANKQQEILTFTSSLVQKYNNSQKVHISAPYATCIRRLST